MAEETKSIAQTLKGHVNSAQIGLERAVGGKLALLQCQRNLTELAAKTLEDLKNSEEAKKALNRVMASIDSQIAAQDNIIFMETGKVKGAQSLLNDVKELVASQEKEAAPAKKKTRRKKNASNSR